MIKGIIIVNNHGKARLTRFYAKITQEQQMQVVREIFAIISKRPEGVCNFVELASTNSSLNPLSAERTDDQQLMILADSKIVYRHYATLYFVFLVDSSESELGILDLIQVFVESLDKRFENVCELDIIFHYDEVHYILDEVVMAGLVLETNIKEIMTAVNDMRKWEKESKSKVRKQDNKVKGGTSL